MKIKKNDNVLVISGRERGKTGAVSSVFLSENKITITGLNIVKKSLKPTKKAPKGGIIEINAKIPSSNVMIICPGCSKATRAKYQIKDKRKTRVCKKCRAAMDNIVK
ncbi:MAG: large subunit ribosomal protein L24 [Candidatus Berkelbacteria bacterium Athens1014_28]|uniref:Large ribosomal subunit protein uL24 n=1 Tax=Candidatus Berkelbacteria bacterium Athens1014_28 TaxID=2017145 RepID=A0A554LQZ6_9BACT|nr:MAG: large subunit ribosomal protein L24 [Candidatus Berkelbacteria bacterium Athens1014_28]